MNKMPGKETNSNTKVARHFYKCWNVCLFELGCRCGRYSGKMALATALSGFLCIFIGFECVCLKIDFFNDHQQYFAWLLAHFNGSRPVYRLEPVVYRFSGESRINSKGSAIGTFGRKHVSPIHYKSNLITMVNGTHWRWVAFYLHQWFSTFFTDVSPEKYIFSLLCHHCETY